jgi:DNA invertase Pin-like site-specific DNA recombinase
MENAIGYARISTDDQTMALQTDALEAAGCVRVFSESGSGKTTKNRDQLQTALDYLNPGDALVV